MHRFRHSLFASLIPLFLASSAFSAQQGTSASTDFFETKIRPVLAANCYGCHTNTSMGGLRVDSAEGLQKGGKKGPAIVPGDPERSLLIQLVRHSDAKQRMPMGNKLKDEEIANLAEWVKGGAAWPKTEVSKTKATGDQYVIHPEQRAFWSFQPLKSPTPPAVKDAKWLRTPIDNFILARLEKEGLAPVKPASRRDLIRRVSFGLTGLPPTPEEIQAFEKDTTKDAFPKVVDRLLASPQYGERWGRAWLDIARFGEDDYRSLDPMRRGFNPYPNAYVYRDWVIQAMNDDMPFDMFAKAQIAGDLLDPSIRHKTLPATGFLGLGPWYYDNGSTEVTRADERNDRVDAVTRGFLGLTVACARCHDHKYDPIPTKDYYSLAGVFLNTKYEEYPLAPKSIVSKFGGIETQIDTKQKLMGEMQNNLTSQLSQSLALSTSNYLQAVWEVTGTQKKDIATVVEARKLDYELLERWIKYMGRKTEKYQHKDAWQAMMLKGGSTADQAKKLADKFQEDVVAVMLTRTELNDENKVIANKAMEGTKAKKRDNKPSNFVTNEDFCPGCALRLKGLPEDQNFFWTEIFQREVNDSDDPNAMMAMGMRNVKPGVLLFRGWGLESRIGASAQAQLAAVRSDIEAQKKKLEPYYPFVHGVKDMEKPTDLPLAIRGNPENLGEPVSRHFLSVLSKSEPAPFSRGSGRLELAEDILKQPLMARVIVNRIWRGHFGTGIVDTPSNFGMTGERPTHPELLEYLASKFMTNGLSLKKLHREILLSAAYQSSTENSAPAFAKDSGNRLYWRANRNRLDAEQLRDSIMFVSGSLDKQLGGPSSDLTPAFKRRTIYGKVSRYKLDQYLQLFDFPNPNLSAEKRFTTTVPLQRLFLMNSDFIQLQAEELAKRVAGEADNTARIRKVYRITFGREPKEQEIQHGLEFLKTEPLVAYEEAKKRKPEKDAAKSDSSKTDATKGKAVKVDEAEGVKGDMPTDEAAKVEMPAPDAPGQTMGQGMMGGMMMPGMMGRRGTGPAPEKEAKYEPTAWGRYAKVLLSSSEFLNIN